MSDATIQHVTTADNVSLTVHRIGDPTGVPVLLAPGTFTNWSFWLGTRGTGFARELAARGFEAWVIDFRGHGFSQFRAGKAEKLLSALAAEVNDQLTMATLMALFGAAPRA